MKSAHTLWVRFGAGRLGSALLQIAAFNSVLLNFFMGLFALAAVHLHWLARGTVSTSGSALLLWLFDGRQGNDSWRPMLRALDCFADRLPIYQTIFFDYRDKFQYPLTSLLPMYALRRWGWNDAEILWLLNIASWIALGLVIALSIRILIVTARRYGFAEEMTGRSVYFVIAGATVCSLVFYPLVKNYVLGQVQTFISLMFAGALYLWLSGREKSSGALLGLICLIKPQYALVLIWFALRRRFSALLTGSAVLLLGLSAATMVFGWREQLAYLDVLRYIAKHGESYFPNESFNGFLNRLLFNGSNLRWTADSFAPYSPLIYVATVISSAALVGVAVFHRFGKPHRSSVLDLCVISLTATVASPVAWEHHYGILLPIFAYLAGSSSAARNKGLLVTAYVLTSNAWSPMNIFAQVPVLNALQSLRFFGALLLLFFLYRQCTGDRPPIAEMSRVRSGSERFAVPIAAE